MVLSGLALKKNVDTPVHLRWLSFLVHCGVYFSLGIIYILPGPTMVRIQRSYNITLKTIAVLLGNRAFGRWFMGALTRGWFRKQYLAAGYLIITAMLFFSTILVPYMRSPSQLAVVFVMHGMAMAYVKNTFRMIIRYHFTHVSYLLRGRAIFYTVGAAVGPFLAYPIAAYPSADYMMRNCSLSREYPFGWKDIPWKTTNCTATDECRNGTQGLTLYLADEANEWDHLYYTSQNFTELYPMNHRWSQCVKIMYQDGVGLALDWFKILYIIAAFIALGTGFIATVVMWRLQKYMKDADQLRPSQHDSGLKKTSENPVPYSDTKNVSSDSSATRNGKGGIKSGTVNSSDTQYGSDGSANFGATGGGAGKELGSLSIPLMSKIANIVKTEIIGFTRCLFGPLASLYKRVRYLNKMLAKKFLAMSASLEGENLLDRAENFIDEADDILGQGFMLLMLVLMMGVGSVLTYQVYIATFMQKQLHGHTLEQALITTAVGTCVLVGTSAVDSLNAKFKLYPVLLIFAIMASISMTILCFIGDGYFYAWLFSMIFAFFAAKIESGVSEIADEWDILTDEFDAYLDSGYSMTEIIIPPVIGFLVAVDPMNLFYCTAAAYFAMTLFLLCLPCSVAKFKIKKKKKFKKRRKSWPDVKLEATIIRGEYNFSEIYRVDSCPSVMARPSDIQEKRWRRLCNEADAYEKLLDRQETFRKRYHLNNYSKQ